MKVRPSVKPMCEKCKIIKRGLAAQVALHDVVVVDALTQLGLVVLGQVFHSGVGIDPGLLKNLLRAGLAYAVNISKADLDSLISGQVNAGNSCHTCQSFLSFVVTNSRPLRRVGAGRGSSADRCAISPVSAYVWDFRKSP